MKDSAGAKATQSFKITIAPDPGGFPATATFQVSTIAGAQFPESGPATAIPLIGTGERAYSISQTERRRPPSSWAAWPAPQWTRRAPCITWTATGCGW